MHEQTSTMAANKSASPNPGIGELDTSADQHVPSSIHGKAQRLGGNAEQIMSAITHLTSSSIGELEGLTNELQKLQTFLKVETERVQHELDSVMAGVRVIIEAIAPWRESSSISGQNGSSGQVPGSRGEKKR